jgi:AraC-like DNA-binding protein
MNYALASRPDDVIVDHNIGRSYVGVNANPLLSVKCMFNGRARYVAEGGREFIVDDSSYVILNEGNAYTIEKRSLTPVETFCVFFPPGMAATIERDLTSPGLRLLDEPAATPSAFNFLEHRRAHGDLISARVLKLRSKLVTNEIVGARLEEELWVLLSAMFSGEAAVLRAVAALPRARASTRREMFRRVHLGCDYLHSNLNQPLSLAELANAAAMSPFHFLRSFRAIFGTTPLAYLSAVRLRRASDLLRHTSLSVSEVAMTVGFASLPSFINLFRRTFGQPPSRYRVSQRN